MPRFGLAAVIYTGPGLLIVFKVLVNRNGTLMYYYYYYYYYYQGVLSGIVWCAFVVFDCVGFLCCVNASNIDNFYVCAKHTSYTLGST
jgi:hypothetical protein